MAKTRWNASRSLRSLALAATLLLGACMDQPAAPRVSPAGGGARADRTGTSVSVTDAAFGASCADDTTQDDGFALDSAMAAAADVYVPSPCVLNVRHQVRVPSNTYLHGDGYESRVRMSIPDSGRIIFIYGVRDVTVRGLHVLRDRGTPDRWNDHFAFGTFGARNVEISGNWVSSTGGVIVDKSDSVRVLGNNLEGLGAVPRPSTSDYISWAGVLINGTNEPGAIVQYARNVVVSGNHINNYHDGIEWYGGQVDPDSTGYDPERRKAVENVLIEHDTVGNVASGIWGAGGRDIVVRDNLVENCGDVCLDAEGSHNVRFTRNRAKYAGYAVLASYFYSSQIVFENNYALQDGVGHGLQPSTDDRPWRRLFAHTGHLEAPDSISVFLQGDTLEYVSATGGNEAGLLTKTSSRLFRMSDSRLLNTVVDMFFRQDSIRENNQGTVEILNNYMRFTKAIARPAIDVGANHTGPGNDPQGTVTVSGNTIVSTVTQGNASSYRPAIRVWQWAWDPLLVTNTITNNSLGSSGYYWRVEHRNDNAAHTWTIYNNGGNIRKTGNTLPNETNTPS